MRLKSLKASGCIRGQVCLQRERGCIAPVPTHPHPHPPELGKIPSTIRHIPPRLQRVLGVFCCFVSSPDKHARP